MPSAKTFRLALATGCAAALLAAAERPAQAAYTAYLFEQGGDVVATGSGSLNLAGLSLVAPGFFTGGAVIPFQGNFQIGAFGTASAYSGLAGPTSLGGGSGGQASSGGGTNVGLLGSFGWIFIPTGYVSGAELGLSTNTYSGATLAGLGVTPGTYVWNWGSGRNADSFTLVVGSAPPAVPAPAAAALFGAGLLGLGLLRRRRG